MMSAYFAGGDRADLLSTFMKTAGQ